MSAFRPLANMRVPSANPALQYRRFSATPTRCLSAVFAETENPELNKILIEVQEKIILPAYLPEAQRKIVYNPSKSDYMRRNPVVIELDGLEHTFSPIDIKKDIPNSKKALAAATKIMQTKEEWDNIATFLAGYKKAGIRLKREHYESLIRRACAAQQEYSIIECAKQTDKTGLILNSDNSIILLMSSVNQKIYNSTQEEGAILRSLKWNRLIWELIQRPEHQKMDHLESRPHWTRSPHQNPVVRGTLLFSQAHAIQVQQAAGEPVEELSKELRNNVEFIANAWKKNPGLDKLNVRGQKLFWKDALSPFYYVRALAQNIKAMELAQEIIGDDAKSLAPIRDTLEKETENFIKAGSENAKGLGLEYESITGRKPVWEQYLKAE
ncbi:hypothetical protein FLONG3_8472 [Fusarium longipes]|uniref:Uncharacterized protein n=1 Tax=Fusarium longipes TaxID=694270 RepID=A0A395S526_9HYPO|nr:hypothetical protein FLONG3_8472 [Fusarium longipes]